MRAPSGLAATAVGGAGAAMPLPLSSLTKKATTSTTTTTMHHPNSTQRIFGSSRRHSTPLQTTRATLDTASDRAGAARRGGTGRNQRASNGSNESTSGGRRSWNQQQQQRRHLDDDGGGGRSAFDRLKPLGPPPQFQNTGSGGSGSIGDYAAAVVAAGFSLSDPDLDPRRVKGALHPSNNFGRSSSTDPASSGFSAADLAAAEREAEAMEGFGEGEELLDEEDGVSSSKKGRLRRRRESSTTSGALANALAALNARDDEEEERDGAFALDNFSPVFAEGKRRGRGIDDGGDGNEAAFFGSEDEVEDDDEEDQSEGNSARPWIEASSPWADDDEDDDDDEKVDEEEEDFGGSVIDVSPSTSSSPSISRREGGVLTATHPGGGRFRVMALSVESGGGGGEEQVDFVTGERIVPQPPSLSSSSSSSAPASAADDDDLESSSSSRRAFAEAFSAAAQALQSRLVVGVRAEADAAAAARATLYQRSSISKLRSEGVVLTGLVATPAGNAYGDALFALALPKRGETAAAAAEEAASAQGAAGDAATAAARAAQGAMRRKGSDIASLSPGTKRAATMAAAALAEQEALLAAAAAGKAAGGKKQQQPPRRGKAAAADDDAPSSPSSGAALPFHRFGPRDPVVLAAIRLGDPNCMPLRDHGLGAGVTGLSSGSGNFYGGGGANSERGNQNNQPVLVEATVIEAATDHLLVAVRAEHADALDATSLASAAAFGSQDTASGIGWRVDAALPDTTTTRQLRALSVLDRPFSEVANAAEVLAAEERAGLAGPGNSRKGGAGVTRGGGAGATLGLSKLARDAKRASSPRPSESSALSPAWTPGELRVRSILLGDPNSRASAETPPDWARHAAWRSAAARLLAAEADKGLNDSQRSAVASALASTLTLWQGPPGTGKTRTLVALLTVLAKASRPESYSEEGDRDAAAAALASASRCVPILACGDTNAAADGLALGLAAAGVRVVRLGATAARAGSSVSSPSPAPSTEKTNAELLASLSLEAVAAETPAGKAAAAARRRAASSTARARVAAAAGDGVAAASSRASARAAREEAYFLEKEASSDVLAKAEVVCSTTATAGDSRRLGVSARFRCVVLDEATQATEPSTLVPLVRGCEQCVLAGDPRQLPPTVASAEARGCGLEQTLFERLMRGSGRRGGIEPVLLDTQYRMHPALSSFPSRAFYGGRLKDGVSVSSSSSAAPDGFPWPAPSTPLAFVDADEGNESRGGSSGGGGGGSLSNPLEAKLALRAAFLLLQPKLTRELEEQEEKEEGGEEGGGEEKKTTSRKSKAKSNDEKAKEISSVAILAPYAGQVRLIRTLLRAACDEELTSPSDSSEPASSSSNKRLARLLRKSLTVSTVDGYQGREADAVVLSTVRANHRGALGFVADPRRANVALTRAKEALVVVGAPSTLAGGGDGGGGRNVWRDWLDDVAAMGAILPGGALPPAPWEVVKKRSSRGVFDDDAEDESDFDVNNSSSSNSNSSSFRDDFAFSSPSHNAASASLEEEEISLGSSAFLEWGDVEEFSPN